ncbi:acyl carrier protein [Streptomyces sp. NPDC059786]|uniref:acyl carrier protein n=1 Tax=Streptomyces sp. NPDC059786 TaxID=3346946 RepID=UPI00366618F6
MSETEITPVRPTSVPPTLPENVMREAVSAVLAVHLPQEESGIPPFDLVGPQSTNLESMGLDSLLIAEIIVELEERLGTLLELRSGTRLETLADLWAALGPAEPA